MIRREQAIMDERLRLLRETYASDDDAISLEAFEVMVAAALEGQQPVGPGGLPFMADPALYYPRGPDLTEPETR